MTTPLVELCFIATMFALIAIGFYCSHRLNSKHPLWVRLIVLLPCLTAFATLASICMDAYQAYWPDVARSASVILIYALVASHFTHNPWLNIRKKGKV